MLDIDETMRDVAEARMIHRTEIEQIYSSAPQPNTVFEKMAADTMKEHMAIIKMHIHTIGLEEENDGPHYQHIRRSFVELCRKYVELSNIEPPIPMLEDQAENFDCPECGAHWTNESDMINCPCKEGEVGF